MSTEAGGDGEVVVTGMLFFTPFSLQHIISKGVEFTLVFQNPLELFYLNMIFGFEQLTLQYAKLPPLPPKTKQNLSKLAFLFCQGYCMV